MRLEDGNHATRTTRFIVIPVNPNYLQAQLLWEQLACAGVSRVVISPGSRSTPLARTALLFDKLQCTVLTDERCAGFFALGLAKASTKPVALLCTSGTAGAHYFPAIIEAAQSGVPLIVVTADRPKKLRRLGAPQTIDQSALFGRYAKMSLDLNEPSSDISAMREMLYWMKRAAMSMLSAPLGPIHVNVPMDEPLTPVELDVEVCRATYAELSPTILWTAPIQEVSTSVDDSIILAMESAFCGLIVCGPDAARTEHERAAIHALARKLGWPLLADVCSGLRFDGEPNLPFYDLFLRHEELARLTPDFVFEFGGVPTSKTLNTYLNRHRARTVRIQRDTLPRDPDQRAHKTVVTDVAEFCDSLILKSKVSRDSLLLDAFWKSAGHLRSHCERVVVGSDAELTFVRTALENMPDNSNLVLASSMAVRYADMIAAPAGKRIHVYAQRGTNGIDGVLSHAAGIAASSDRPTFLICGDLAFLHDLGGWMNARKQSNLRVLLLNNNGGGIFHFLPVAEYEGTFESLHGTPLNVNLSAAADVYDIQWELCELPNDISRCLNWSNCAGPKVVEVKTERVANRAAHERIVNEMLRCLG